MRSDVDFLVIGTKRGGTTSFYFDLLDHPSVVPLYPPAVPLLKSVPTKGIHYFDSNATKSARWYRSHMPTNWARRRHARRSGGQSVAGEASPFYLFHPAAASRAAALVPDARLIVLLRDPVDRTYSHWKERRRSNAEELEFIDALDAEPARLEGARDRLLHDASATSYAYEQQSYLTQSLYADSLSIWLTYYERDQLLVLASEEYYADPAATLAATHSFLGLEPRARSTGERLNAASGTDLDAATRAMLGARFAEPNRRLEALVDRIFPWT